ncbi:DNA-directed RNA polymerases II and IV subunit 5A-like [Vigna radiata var. radiata]|uniref:DNA-directed RNA polymerases II and IV subunit 5A-like n=1 Tax=Vigna radiata var. radiata TaxID=3916 RepID=A0A1S3UXF8_VIGRR|nr:DNA-directed RNA polymerases II and IV subunit 5A-like [Vigna radiata var. radiata]
MVLPDEEISRLYRIRKTVMQMLRDRGYLVEDFEINMSKHEFKSKYGKHMKREDLVINKKDNAGDQIYVFFLKERGGSNVSVATLMTCIRRMRSEKVFKAILVLQNNLSSFAAKAISQFSDKIHFDVFQEAELLVVPVFTDAEKKTLTEKLSYLEVTDPIARYYGLKRD